MVGKRTEGKFAGESGRLIAAAVGAVVLALLGLLGWQGWDYRRQLHEVEAARAALEQALAAVPAPEPGDEAELQALEQEMKERFPETLDLEALAEEARKQAAAQGLGLLAFEPLLAQTIDRSYRLQPIRLRLLGPGQQVMALAEVLQGRPGLQRAWVNFSRDLTQGEGQFELHWDWYLALPGDAGEESCPEPGPDLAVPPLGGNLLVAVWPRLRREREAAEVLQQRLSEAKQQARSECLRRARRQTLSGRRAVAEALERELFPSDH